MRTLFVLLALGSSIAHADVRRLWIYNVHTHVELNSAIGDDAGILDPVVWSKWNFLWRSFRTGEERGVNRRLLRILSVIQSHFQNRRLELISGVRTPPGEVHSYHALSKAADIRIPGVSNSAIYDFCRSAFQSVGCGKYDTHCHVDVRSRNAIWSQP